MKKALLILSLVLAGCNPFAVFNELSKGKLAQELTEVLTTKITINIGESVRVVSVPTLLLNKYLGKNEFWTEQYKTDSGYAFHCVLMKLRRINGNFDLELYIKYIDQSNEWEDYFWNFWVTDEEWTGVREVIPEKTIRNTDVYINFK